AKTPRAAEERQGADAQGWPRRRAAGGRHRRAPGGPEPLWGKVMRAGIYVHVPFCLTRCGYCDFNAHAGLERLAPRYVRALCAEADLAAPSWGGVPVASTFFGGGTPT